MVIRIAGLNSTNPNSGTKKLDTDQISEDFITQGRIGISEHGASVISETGGVITVDKSKWVVECYRNASAGNVSSQASLKVVFHVVNAETVTATGDGYVIARVSKSIVDSQNTSESGTTEGALEFIAGTSVGDIDAAISGDFYTVVASYQSSVLEEGYKASLSTLGSDLDMGGAYIKNIPTPVDPGDPVDYSTFLSVTGPSAVSDLSLVVSSANGGVVNLSWNDFLGGDPGWEYEIVRGSSQTTVTSVIGTVNSGLTTFQDSSPNTNNYYYVKAVNLVFSYEVYSNLVYADSSGNLIVPNSFYGDGSDGSFTGGTLTKDFIYNFTDINLASNMTIEGNIIFVSGNVQTNGFSIISAKNDGTSGQIVDFDGTTYDLNQTPLTVAQGGGPTSGPDNSGNIQINGGNGGDAAPDRNSAGEDGSNKPGIGGAAPTAPNYQGQDGQVGVGGTIFGGWDGGSGGGGSHGWGHNGTMWFVGGDWDDTGSIIQGDGSDGGNGGNGAHSLINNHSGVGQGGHGGGGGQGGDGMRMYVKVAGTVTNSSTNNVSGGGKGIGGTGHPGSNSSVNPDGGNVAGGPGQDGLNGANGSLTFI